MKKLGLAIGLGAYIVFSASANSLAASRIDTASGVAAIRDSRIAWAVTGTNARLLFLNEALYPETTGATIVDTASQLEHRNGERASTSSVDTASQLEHRKGERAENAQPATTSTETQRMFCDGDICLVP